MNNPKLYPLGSLRGAWGAGFKGGKGSTIEDLLASLDGWLGCEEMATYQDCCSRREIAVLRRVTSMIRAMGEE